MIYQHRTYYSSTRIDFSKEVGEPIQYSFSPSNGGADKSWRRYVSENKQVFAVEALIGKEVHWFKKNLVDIYAGVGYRYKYKEQEIFGEKDGEITINYSLPKKEKIDGYLPTIQAGMRIGILSIPKTHSAESK